MQQFPHHYQVNANANNDGEVVLQSDGVTALSSQPPPEFGGPGGYWSPETLLVAAVADCFVLSFRAIARASKFSWNDLRCDVQGVLDRVDSKSKFTEFAVNATLSVPADSSRDRAQRLLEKAEATCLITNSLTATVCLTTEIKTAGT